MHFGPIWHSGFTLIRIIEGIGKQFADGTSVFWDDTLSEDKMQVLYGVCVGYTCVMIRVHCSSLFKYISNDF